jgi:hypothetical protein
MYCALVMYYVRFKNKTTKNGLFVGKSSKWSKFISLSNSCQVVFFKWGLLKQTARVHSKAVIGKIVASDWEKCHRWSEKVSEVIGKSVTSDREKCHKWSGKVSPVDHAFYAFYALRVLFSVIGGPCKRYAMTLTRIIERSRIRHTAYPGGPTVVLRRTCI